MVTMATMGLAGCWLVVVLVLVGGRVGALSLAVAAVCVSHVASHAPRGSSSLVVVFIISKP